ncbi:MAG: ROK family protein [Eubacterium sp.]|nr:ROK family protein [Eubacterium sp.]
MVLLEQDTLKNIRNKNLSDILQVLRDKGACSLAELTENTAGGLTTVKKCVFQAMDYGMILEGDIADSTGGRKAKQYLINEQYQYFLFIIIDNNNLIFKIQNFKFECVDNYTVHFDMDEFFKVVCKNIDKIAGKYDLGTICLSMPCVVKDGVILDWYYNSDMNGFDLKAALESQYKLNTIIQNDMKLTVIGESTESRQNTKNIVTMQFGHNGIGVGEMANGHLLEGNAGFAGEVGYINDLRKNIMGISYPAKIVRNAIVFLNPEVIVFYKSDRQNQFKEIFEKAVFGLPHYAVPRFEISNNYDDSIIAGLVSLINKYGFFKKAEEEK